MLNNDDKIVEFSIQLLTIKFCTSILHTIFKNYIIFKKLNSIYIMKKYNIMMLCIYVC